MHHLAGMRTSSSGGGSPSSKKLSYKEAVVGRKGEKGLEVKSVHSLGICGDKKSIDAIMNVVRGGGDLEESCQPPTFFPKQHPSGPQKLPDLKWAGDKNLVSDCDRKTWLSENLKDGIRGGGGELKSPAWEVKKRAWSRTGQQWVGIDQMRNTQQGFGGKASLANKDSNKQRFDTVGQQQSSRLVKEITSGSSSSSRLTKHIGGVLSGSSEIRELSLPAAGSSIGGKIFIPSQHKGSTCSLERKSNERRNIPVVSAKSLLEEEKAGRLQAVSPLSSWPTFPNKKTVYFFPKTLNLPNYTFDMVYYQDPDGEFGFPSVSKSGDFEFWIGPCVFWQNCAVASVPQYLLVLITIVLESTT